MLSDHTPLQKLGYTLMACVVAFGLAFVIGKALRRPATIELHQTDQPPVVIPPDPPYGSKRSDFTTPYTPIQSQPGPSQSSVLDVPPTPAAGSSSGQPDSTGRQGKHPTEVVNVNTATDQELQTLPGIGATLAKRIVEYRETHQPFQNVDDLQAVQGFGKKRLDKIRQWLTVGQ